MNKKILIITSEFPPLPGGIGNHAYHLALQFNKLGYLVQVITDQRSEGTADFDFDRTLPFKVSRITLKRIRGLMYLNRILITIRACKHSDYVIASGKFSLWNVAFSSLFFKRQTLAVLHGSEVNLKKPVLRKMTNSALNQFDTLVAVSQYTKQLVAHLGRPIEVIPNGIDVTTWLDTVPPLALTGSPVLTTVGRVSARKGQLEVIKQIPELLETFPELHYHCIGLPTEAVACKRMALNLGVSEHVTFHGALSTNTLKQALAATDIFVMLSTESKTGDVEGFGIAILEANALGIPAIGAKGCGIEDAISDGVTGFLIDGDNIAHFATSIKQLQQNYKYFSQHAKTWAIKHDWSQIIKQYEAVLTCAH
ncbi:glycosyltransferase family 4 protein [Hanstruepera flava]|uniref:glycosyltransferase family 4 protein n=1 Tax=Hanstruepera flava TaxID=2930218 RepID=UPI0020288B01|nr:glycosyltransferase family 4 protein [Hanstruepera flava]